MESPGAIPQRVPIYATCPQCGYVMKGLEVGVTAGPPGTAEVEARCEECGWSACAQMSTIELAEAVGEMDLLLDDAGTPNNGQPCLSALRPESAGSGAGLPDLLDRPVFAVPGAPPAAGIPRKATTTVRRVLAPTRARSRVEAFVLVGLSLVAISAGLVELVLLRTQLPVGLYVLLVAVLLPVTVGLFLRGLCALWRDTRR